MRQLYIRTRSLRRFLSSIGRRSKEEKSEPLDEKPPAKPSWRCFSYEEIYKATDGFHKDNLVGRGGHAEVYRGVAEDGQVIAVKTLMRASSDEQREKDFLTELGTVGHVRHPNVSSLLGCCIDRDLHLIFEFSSRGSVSSNLHDEKSPPMPWKLRYSIALGTARGLHYLHKQCRRRIIHRDIKASNILLATNFEAQVATALFLAAKPLCSRGQPQKEILLRLRFQISASLNGSPPSGLTAPSVRSKAHSGTHLQLRSEFELRLAIQSVIKVDDVDRCLAPEYFMHGIVDEKTDVFSFGVFLLEITSGRKPVDGSNRSLLSWARPFVNDDSTIQMLVDPRLGDDYDVGQLKSLTFSASLCIRANAALRPSMTEVMEILEGGEISGDRWNMPEEEEEEFWSFDDLDDDDSDDGDCHTASAKSTGS